MAPGVLPTGVPGSSVRGVNRGRRCVAALTAAVLVGDALVLGMVHLVLGMAVDRQEMSVAGLSTTAMSTTTWTAGGLLAVFLLVCGVLAARTCVTDRAPGRPARVLLVGAAVLHAVLASVAVGIAGWGVFTALMLVFGLIVLTLTMYPPAGQPPPRPGAAGSPAAAPGPASDPAPGPASDPQVGDGDAHLGEQLPQQR